MPHSFAKNAQTKLQALTHMWTNGWSISHTSAVLNFSSLAQSLFGSNSTKEMAFRGLNVAEDDP